MGAVDRREVARFVVVASVSLGAATLAVAFLQDVLNVPKSVLALPRRGRHDGDRFRDVGRRHRVDRSRSRSTTSCSSSRATRSRRPARRVREPVLLLFVGIVVGQLAALQRAAPTRPSPASARLARCSRSAARSRRGRRRRPSCRTIVAILRAETAMGRIWIGLGPEPRARRVAADTGDGPRPPSGLQPGAPADARRHAGPLGPRPPAGRRAPAGRRTRGVYRVRIEAGGRAVRLDLGARGRGDDGAARPDRDATPRRGGGPDRPGARARTASRPRPGPPRSPGRATRSSRRCSSRSRTTCGRRWPRSGRPPGRSGPGQPLSADDQRESADAIDREVEYLEPARHEPARPQPDRGRRPPRRPRRVRARRPRRPDARAAADRGSRDRRSRSRSRRRRSRSTRSSSTRRSRTRSRTRSSTRRPGRRSGSSASRRPDERFVRLTIEDAGPGVPDDALPRLFDKFYRVPGRDRRLAVRDRDRARRRARPDRGDGRPGPARAGASWAVSRSISTCRRRAAARRSTRAQA